MPPQMIPGTTSRLLLTAMTTHQFYAAISAHVLEHTDEILRSPHVQRAHVSQLNKTGARESLHCECTKRSVMTTEADRDRR